MNKKKLALIAIAVLLVVVTATIGIKWVLKDDAKRQLFYEQRAILVGVARAKSECLKASYSADVCSSLNGKASTVSDVTSETIWIIYVTSGDGTSYKVLLPVDDRFRSAATISLETL